MWWETLAQLAPTERQTGVDFLSCLLHFWATTATFLSILSTKIFYYSPFFLLLCDNNLLVFVCLLVTSLSNVPLFHPAGANDTTENWIVVREDIVKQRLKRLCGVSLLWEGGGGNKAST